MNYFDVYIYAFKFIKKESVKNN